ncbi:MAG: hypothetical protein K1X28_05340 [Parachlamydiales bacterium]|nr:hypothetical protein [Parachlamydiales bacterium]
MAAIAPLVEHQLLNPAQQTQPSEGLVSLKELVITAFAAAIAVIVANFYGFGFGLLAGIALQFAATLIDRLIANLCVKKEFVLLSEELGLNPAEEIHPQRRNIARLDQLDDAGRERHQENIGHLLAFDRTIRTAIIRQSPHYESAGPFAFLRDHFPNMDYSGLRLLGIKPFRFKNTGQEGYEIAIRSQNPQGWIYFLALKNGVLQEGGGEMERIERVTPFMRREQAEANHLSILGLPFMRTDHLHLKLAADDRDMDLCQVEVDSVNPVRFDFVVQLMPGLNPLIQTYDGYELNLRTPRGIVQYYADPRGRHIAKPNEVRNIAPRVEM